MHSARWILIGLVLVSVLAATSAKADQLVAGGLGTADTFSLGYSGSPTTGLPRTVVATSGYPFPTWAQGTFSGQFYEQVEFDPSNVFCAGCVDFIFQVNNKSTEDITRITEAGFSAYQTDVGYDLVSLGGVTLCGPDDNAFCNSGKLGTVPFSVDRSADGDVVGFNLAGVGQNDSTVDLVIETNALTYVDPLMTIYGSNGGVGTLTVFGPSGPPVGGVPIPEPSSLLLLGSGLASLGFIRRRAKSR